MWTRLPLICAATGGLIYAPMALALGDPTALYVAYGVLLLILVFLCSLPSWRNWRERGLVSLFFAVALVGVNVATAKYPYSANANWLAPTLLIAPIIGWMAGAFITKRLRKK